MKRISLIALLIASFTLSACGSVLPPSGVQYKRLTGEVKKTADSQEQFRKDFVTKKDLPDQVKPIVASVVADQVKREVAQLQATVDDLVSKVGTKAENTELAKLQTALEALKSELTNAKTDSTKLLTVQTSITTLTAEVKAAKDAAESAQEQARKNEKTMELLAAHQRGDQKTADRLKSELASYFKGTGISFIQLSGFPLDDANSAELTASHKRAVAEAKKIGKPLGIVGIEDGVPCKKPVTKECRTVAQRRAEAAVKEGGWDKKLITTLKPRPEWGRDNDPEWRGVTIVVQKMAPVAQAPAQPAPPTPSASAPVSPAVPSAPTAPAQSRPPATPPVAKAPVAPAKPPASAGCPFYNPLCWF